MKTVKLAFLLLIALAGGGLIFQSCNKNTSNAPGHLQVMLTDGPANYDAVYIDVQKVEVNVSSDSGAGSGWQTVNLLRPGVYNLLKFSNGIDTLLASADLPAGALSQMRLVLGNNNSVVIGGQTYPLKTPSAQQSGLKFNIHSTLTAGIEYRLWIDFNAGRSIVVTGNGDHILKPVIRTYSEAVGGSIKGFALPYAARPEVWAVMGADTLLALPDSTTGYYFFGGVNAGTWNLLFHAQDTTYKDTTFPVNVSTGLLSNAGTVTLVKK